VEYPELLVPTAERVSCTSLSSFGNGLLCLDEDGEVDLSLCATEEGACSPGRLCMDSAATLSCTCEKDQDCVGYIAYVNEARKGADQTELPPLCEVGACVGDLDEALSLGDLGNILSGDEG
jgi:hypothetical protein